MTARRTDANQQEIVDALRKAGCRVQCTHAVGRGFPDLVVLTPDGLLVLLEVKMPGANLNRRERDWHAEWNHAPVFVVRLAEEALWLVS